MKANFGCGRKKKDGWINIDIVKENKPDLVMNMENFPYPFKDESLDEIECNMTLEHIKKPFGAIREFHRILKKGGKLYIYVPHATSSCALSGEEHCSMFWSTSLWQFHDKKPLCSQEFEDWKGANAMPIFSEMKIELLFPKNTLRYPMMPFTWIFSKGRFAQLFYEQFFSGIIRCNDIYMEATK